MKELIKKLKECIRLNRPFLIRPDDAIELLNYLGER